MFTPRVGEHTLERETNPMGASLLNPSHKVHLLQNIPDGEGKGL